MSEAIRKRINDVRKMAADDIHAIFRCPKKRVVMLLNYLDKGGDLKAMAVKIQRKKGGKESRGASHGAKKPLAKKVTPSKPKR